MPELSGFIINMKISISLKIRKELKDTLAKLSNNDGRSETWHLERALLNYFKIKLGNRIKIKE